MWVIQLCSAVSSGHAAGVGARGNAGTRNIEAITISERECGGTAFGPAEFWINTPFVLPLDFVKDGRLKTWTEVQTDIKDLTGGADAAAAAAREKACDALRETLANCPIDLTAKIDSPQWGWPSMSSFQRIKRCRCRGCRADYIWSTSLQLRPAEKK